MEVLDRLERAYLGALRVVILVAATGALIIAALGVLSAVPPLLSSTGIIDHEKPSGGDLRQFIEERKISETTASSTGVSSEMYVSRDAKSAAFNIVRYLKSATTIKERDWGQNMQRLANDVPGHEAELAASLKDLSGQLIASKGKPLSEARVIELLGWHSEQFKSSVAASLAAEAQANAKFWVTLGGAGAAFLAFILTIFVFLFVKIERSLRIVRTTRVVPPAPAED